MESTTMQFVVFLAFSMACFFGGYACRKKGWVDEKHSRPIHLFTIIFLWAPVSLVIFWELSFEGANGRDVILLMVAQPILMCLSAAIMAFAVPWRRLKTPPEQRGVMILAAALSNHGFPLGAYFCYAMLNDNPGDPERALYLGSAYVTSMQIFMILIFYPVARHYGPEDTRSMPKLILGSFIKPAAIPLYMAALGATLNLSGVPAPDWIESSGILIVFFYLGALGSYGGIGLRFRFSDSNDSLKMQGILAASQFAVYPLITLAFLALVATGSLHPQPLTRGVFILEAFTPTALNTVIVCNLFHLDARLASNLWLWNTLAFAVIVAPILIFFY
jgi:predicted permease